MFINKYRIKQENNYQTKIDGFYYIEKKNFLNG